MGSGSNPSVWRVRDRQGAILLGALFCIMLYLGFRDRAGADLTPTWFAGLFFAAGDPGSIYPAPGAIFTTMPPESWAALAHRLGFTDPVFAYIYPPLWAALVAPVTGLISMATFQNAVLMVNILSLLGTIFLARRIAAPRVSPSLFTALAILIFLLGPFAPLALGLGQIQVFVGFLTLLAIERGRAGAPVTSGAILGLAVALKIAPVLILPALMASGDWRRTGAGFLLAGGALGALSLALAGWPLHARFLATLSAISDSVLLSRIAYTFDALVAQFRPAADRLPMTLVVQGGHTLDWAVLVKTPALRAISTAIMLLAAFWPVRPFRRGAGPFMWPAVLILIGLTGNIGWSYYYIAPLAFLPALIAPFGPLRGGLLALALYFPGSFFGLPFVRGSEVMFYPDQALGIATLIVTAGVFLWLAFRPDQALRPNARQV